MSKFLRKDTKDKLKESFKLTKIGWIYKPPHREIGITLTFSEMAEIHDFVVFQGSGEYMEWVRSKAKELNNG